MPCGVSALPGQDQDDTGGHRYGDAFAEHQDASGPRWEPDQRRLPTIVEQPRPPRDVPSLSRSVP